MGGHGPRMILPHLVIGGGPAGAMTAAGLARRGEAVVLLEKTAGPHSKICGEFLSWEARDMLRRKGVTLPGGAPIDRLRIVASRLMREVPLPAEALGISRFELDEALLNHAARCGAEIRRGVHVGAFLPPRAVRLRDGSRLQAERIYLATGKTELRGAARDTGRQRVTRDLTGYKMHLRLPAEHAAALSRTIELHRFDGGYAGLQPVAEDRHNLCLLARDRQARGWPDILRLLEQRAPALYRRIDRAEFLYDRPLAISRVPYGYRRLSADGPLAIGDQHAVIHSFTGDGLALAIATGIAAGEYPSESSDCRHHLDALTSRPVRLAAAAYRLIDNISGVLRIVGGSPLLVRSLARATRVRMPQR